MIFNVTGGGGTALNFKVTAYATEAALMAATPKENTIGIITTTPITSWIFSAEEPSPAESGMVWITTGTESGVAFNALGKNTLQVYPISAKQYVSGAWTDVTAKSYQGGEWRKWITYLIDRTGLTEAVGPLKCYVENSAATLTYSETGNGVTLTRTGANYSAAYSENLIDVTKYDTMYISIGSKANRLICGLSSVTGKYTNWWINNSPAQMYVDANTVNAIDISEVSGSYYLAFGPLDAGNYNDITVWLQ